MLAIDQRSTEPIYRQIINGIKEQVARGILKVDDKIPSIRELSAQIVVNPNTVSKAYQELEREGIIVTIRGRGTFIAEQLQGVIPAKEIERIRMQMKQIVLEGYYAGIEEEVMHDWIACYYNQYGGQKS